MGYLYFCMRGGWPSSGERVTGRRSRRRARLIVVRPSSSSSSPSTNLRSTHARRPSRARGRRRGRPSPGTARRGRPRWIAGRRALAVRTTLRCTTAATRNVTPAICNPNSCLNYLLPPKRDTSVTSRLRAATPYPRPTLRTKKYCSFINYGLSHYQ